MRHAFFVSRKDSQDSLVSSSRNRCLSLFLLGRSWVLTVWLYGGTIIINMMELFQILGLGFPLLLRHEQPMWKTPGAKATGSRSEKELCPSKTVVYLVLHVQSVLQALS